MDDQSLFWQIMAGRQPIPPAAQTLGARFLSVDGEAGVVELSFEARPEFTNPVGNVQGGFLAAMLDDTLGPALTATLGRNEFAPTLNLNVSFERAGKVGTIIGRGRVVRRGKDICFIAGELYQDGERIASATATAMIRGLTRP